MGIRLNREMVWIYYNHVKEQQASRINPKEYCKANGIKLKNFTAYKYYFNYGNKFELDEYHRQMTIGRDYLNSGMTAKWYSSNHNIDINVLRLISRHLQYNDVVTAKLKEEEEQPKPMKFLQVPAAAPRIIPVQPELIEKQNDLEIIISKGVKVIISPNIDSMKIIKSSFHIMDTILQ